MKYSKQEKEMIYEMKKSIINEFRYYYKSHDIGFLANFYEPDMSQDVEDLKEAFQIGMSYQENKIIRA